MSSHAGLYEAPAQPSFLGTRRGKLTLAFVCMVGFLDFVDASIVNVALPSIRRDLHFSVQSLQWVLSAYLLTYGGFMLLGGRAADLLGRRRILVAGMSLFALSSLIGGLADRLRDVDRRPSRPGARRGHDASGRALDPDHHLPRGEGSEHGARRLGRDRRARVRGGGVPRRGAERGRRLALGSLGQPARQRRPARRNVPRSSAASDRRHR